MSWEGGNFEDAIIISERLVRDDMFTSIHIEKHEIEARDTKLGPEEITRDIPNVGEESLRDLDEDGIIHIGAEVRPGDILVGKITPKGETELTAEERLLRAIFGEKAREVKDTSLRVPHGERGKVVDVRVFRRELNDELPAGVNQLVRVSRRPEAQDLRRRQDGRPPRQQGRDRQDPAGRGHAVPAGRHAGRHHPQPARRAEPHEHRPDPRDAPRLGAPRAWAETAATPVFDGATEDAHPRASSSEAGLPRGRQDRACTTAAPASRSTSEVTVGYIYMLKLVHLVEDKIHARSTGPYCLITQQPLGGKAQFGGQRFGEMEVWALEAYGAAQHPPGAAHRQVGRRRRPRQDLRGHRQGRGHPASPACPESFKVLVKELQSLGLAVEVLNENEEEIPLVEDDAAGYLLPDLGGSTSPGSRTDHELAHPRGRSPAGDRRRQPVRIAPRARRRRGGERCSKSTTSTRSASRSPARSRSASGRRARSPSRRRSTTARSSRRRTASSASASSVPPRTGSATAASTSASATRASSATSAASRSRAPRSAASGWATSSWPARSATSGSSRARPARLGLLLDITPRNLERILYFALYIVTDVDEDDAQARARRSSRKRPRAAAARPASGSSELEDELEADIERQPRRADGRARRRPRPSSRRSAPAATEEIVAAAQAASRRGSPSSRPARPRSRSSSSRPARSSSPPATRAARTATTALRKRRRAPRPSASTRRSSSARRDEADAPSSRRSPTCAPRMDETLARRAGASSRSRPRASRTSCASCATSSSRLKPMLTLGETEFRDARREVRPGRQGPPVQRRHGRRGGARHHQPDRPRRAGPRSCTSRSGPAPASAARRRPSACASSRPSASPAPGPSG